jgi:hypothetical protein
MPRVYTKTARKSKYQRTCTGCGQPVAPGHTYYTWEKRYGGPRYRHTACGYPRPSELSGRKTAIVEDAIQDAGTAIGQWTPELGAYATDDLLSVLEQVADQAEEVGDEYEGSADNMPESLQYGTQAEAMREVAQELRDWAEELRSWQPDEEEPDLPDRSDYTDDEDGAGEYQEAVDQAISDWADQVRDSATDKLADLPEYQG